MRLDHEIHGSKVVLVPYKKEHVQKYHGWMESDVLRKLTASDKLTLDEEYEQQEDWVADPNKLTFIILHKEELKKDPSDEVNAMIGDVNLFFQEDESEDLGEIGKELEKLEIGIEPKCPPPVGVKEVKLSSNPEINIMIAELDRFVRKGLGTEAVCLTMRYAIERLGAKSFTAKILQENVNSIGFFEDGLQFAKVDGRGEIFQEVWYNLIVDDAAMDMIKENTSIYEMKPIETYNGEK
mmetsp:Transcript_118865/g.207058  ORF Transcript_118865/g.207058 Transcript_118865/m.207058 type:complete len:238 (-) Transcript_118865:899-1612(-)